jgi:hypothetical protein
LVEFAPVVQELAGLAKAKMLDLIKQGVDVPGYKAVQSLKNRTWINEKSAVTALAERYPDSVMDFVKASLKSPAQVEKIVPKTVLEEMNIYHRPLGAISVAKVDSSLQEVSFNDFDVLGE